MVCRFVYAGLFTALLMSPCLESQDASAAGKRYQRIISYQDKNDLFYNNYVGPDPSGTAAAMYIAPRPVPPHVGHTYVTYQPLMPQEYLYRHTRSHYTYNPGAGWTRAKVRYRTRGLSLQHIGHKLNWRY